MTYHDIFVMRIMTYHEISWHIMTFCHKYKNIIFVAKMRNYDIIVAKTRNYDIFVAKTRNYDIFVAKIYDYALIDSFWGFHRFIDSPTSYATLPLGKGPVTKSDEFSEKFKTAFGPSPPSFLGNYNAIFLWQKWLHICEEI